MTRRHLLFLGAEGCAYLLFLWLDVQGAWSLSTAVKYAGLLGCLLFALCHRGSRAQRLTAAALCFTALADLFLLVLDGGYGYGVAAFCVVQGLYFLRLHPAWDKGAKGSLALRLAMVLAVFFALAALSMVTPLNLLAGFYFCQLLCNTLDSFFAPAGTGKGAFSIGLVLFVCCDICVGLHNLPLDSRALAAFARFGMWLFYLPSQVLLVLSACLKEGSFHER